MNEHTPKLHVEGPSRRMLFNEGGCFVAETRSPELAASIIRLARMAEAGKELRDVAQLASPEVPHRCRGLSGAALYECDPETCVAHRLDRAIAKFEEASQ